MYLIDYWRQLIIGLLPKTSRKQRLKEDKKMDEWRKMLMRKTKKEIIRHLEAVIEQKKALRVENLEMTPTVKVEFKSMPSYILPEYEYNELGKFKGFCSKNHINPKDVKKVHHILMDVKDYPTIAWEG